MAPRSFSEDGAQGATQTGDPTFGSSAGFGSSAPGQIPAGGAGNFWGLNPNGNTASVNTSVGGGAAMGTSRPGSNLDLMFADGGVIPEPDDDDDDQAPTQVASNMPAVPGNQSNSGAAPMQPFPSTQRPQAPAGSFGKRTTDASDPSGGGTDINQAIALALASVDAGLDYGRKQYGLGDAMAPNTQTGSNMPATPGNQSNSGIPAQQPFPSTQRPMVPPGAFGQRTSDASGDNQDQDQSAIPEPDEETA